MYWLKRCSLGCFVLPCSSPQRRPVSPSQWFLWPGDSSCWVSRHQRRPEVMISLILVSSSGWVFRSWFTLWWDLAEADFPLAASSFPFAWGNPQVSLTCSVNPPPFPHVFSPRCCTVNLILRHLPNSLFPLKISLKGLLVSERWTIFFKPKLEIHRGHQRLSF